MKPDGRLSEAATAEKESRRIIPNRIVLRPYFAKKVALAVAGTTVLIVVGVMNAPSVRAQAQSSAQSPVAATPKFEVVSVKRGTGCGDGGGRKGGGGGSLSPGRLGLECRTVMSLIRMAYVQFAGGTRRPPGRAVPISGGGAWINSDSYTIDAKAEGAPGPDMMRGPMLQALLEDRFKLKIHRETRTVPVYELTVAKGGPKLQAAKEGSCVTFDRNHPPPEPAPGQPLPRMCGFFSGDYMYGTTMADLCGQLSAFSDRDVIDKTGIAGAFDIHLGLSLADLFPGPPGDGAPGIGDPAPPATPTNEAFFAALQNVLPRLGLKLESAKGPGQFLVIDRVERPSEN